MAHRPSCFTACGVFPDQTHVSCIGRRILYHSATREVPVVNSELVNFLLMMFLCCVLEKAVATHSSTLAWKIPWAEEPGSLQSMGSLSWTRLSDFTFFSLSCIGEGNGNPLQCSCLENPRDGGVWWAAVSGRTGLHMTDVTWQQQQQCCLFTLALSQ